MEITSEQYSMLMKGLEVVARHLIEKLENTTEKDMMYTSQYEAVVFELEKVKKKKY